MFGDLIVLVNIKAIQEYIRLIRQSAQKCFTLAQPFDENEIAPRYFRNLIGFRKKMLNYVKFISERFCL